MIIEGEAAVSVSGRRKASLGPADSAGDGDLGRWSAGRPVRRPLRQRSSSCRARKFRELARPLAPDRVRLSEGDGPQASRSGRRQSRPPYTPADRGLIPAREATVSLAARSAPPGCATAAGNDGRSLLPRLGTPRRARSLQSVVGRSQTRSPPWHAVEDRQRNLPGSRRESHTSHMRDARAPPREMVRRRAVPEVGVNDYAEALELLQVPVDGRDGDVRGLSLNLGRQLLGRPVPRRLEQGADEKDAAASSPDRRSDAHARRALARRPASEAVESSSSGPPRLPSTQLMAGANLIQRRQV